MVERCSVVAQDNNRGWPAPANLDGTGTTGRSRVFRQAFVSLRAEFHPKMIKRTSNNQKFSQMLLRLGESPRLPAEPKSDVEFT